VNRRPGLLIGLLSVVVLMIAAAFILARQVGLTPDGLVSGGSPSPELPFPELLAVEDVYAAFETGGTAISGGDPSMLSAVPAGDLLLPTGRVVAADMAFFTNEPFTRRLPAGRYPVSWLSSARDPDLMGDVAAAMIRVGPGDPVSWELAVVPGQDPKTLKPGEVFGYPVDSGTGVFASVEAADTVMMLMKGGDVEGYFDQIIQGLDPGGGVYNQSVAVTLDRASGVNVIAFVSGFGDGYYPSWFGLDANGQPLVLLTDFGILEAPTP
jgi:Protein of unknown function (DUF4241)